MYRNEFNSALLILTAESADNRKEMSNLSQGLGMIEEATTKLAKMSTKLRTNPKTLGSLRNDCYVAVRLSMSNENFSLSGFFSDHPSYKDIWPQFREVPDSSLMNAEALRKHAAVYTCGIRKVISSMSDDVELEKALRRIAHAHVERNIHKRHLMSMLPCFLKAFEEYKTLDEQSREAWTTLFDVIANLIDIFRV
ncbi:GLOBIN domain-containing protein [Aphelenchoides besseyi]|nr:GLOBIN domain-containing protein [Aphelenchoides besseyi]